MTATTGRKTAGTTSAKSKKTNQEGGGTMTNRVAEIPSASKYLDTYINRTIAGLTDFEWYEHALQTGKNILIESPTGCGKTHSVFAYAASKNLACVAINFSVSTEDSKLFGRKTIEIVNGQEEIFWQDGGITDIFRHGGVIILDELNFASATQLASLYPVLDKRRQLHLTDNKFEVIEAHPDVLIVAMMNPNYEGTRDLNKALRNRFPIQLVFDYEFDIEDQLLQSDALLQMAAQIRQQVGERKIKSPVSTNMLVEFEEIAQSLNIEAAVYTFVNHFEPAARGAVLQTVKTWEANISEELFPTKTKKKSKAKVSEDWNELNAEWVYEEDNK